MQVCITSASGILNSCRPKSNSRTRIGGAVEPELYPLYDVLSAEHLSEKTLNWFLGQQGDGPLDLSDIADTCATFHITATLFDANGLVRGRVDEQGIATMLPTYESILEAALLVGQGWAECLFLSDPWKRLQPFSEVATPAQAWAISPGDTWEQKSENVVIVYAAAENRWCALQNEESLRLIRFGNEP